MASSSGGLNSSYANASRALSSKVSSQSYNLRAEANSQREVAVNQQNQIDPSVLARIALEEELKKKGGGGGGGRSYNPINWIPYSFSLLAKAIEQARTEVANAFLQALATINQSIQAAINQFGANLGKALSPITNFTSNIVTGFAQNISRSIEAFSKNPIAFAGRMATNAMQTGIAIFAALVNGLKKVIYGKDESLAEADEENYKKEGIFSKLLSFFTLQGEDNESNQKNTKSHLNNKAKQQTQRITKKANYSTTA